MQEIDDLLESIKSSEIDRNPGINPSRLNEIQIRKTSELTGSKRIVRDTASKQFRPSIVYKLIVTCLLILVILARVTRVRNDSSNVFFALLIMVVGGWALYPMYTDKNQNFKIVIDREGIKISETQYKWSDIQETAILYLPVKRNEINYLVILLKDNTYEKFDISNFRSFEGFRKTLSKYIEYLKPIT